MGEVYLVWYIYLILGGVICNVALMALMVCGIIAMLPMLFLPQADILMACCIIILISLTERYCKYIEKCAEYLETGDEELGKEIQGEAIGNLVELVIAILLMYTMYILVNAYVGSKVSGGETIESGETGGTVEPSGKVKPGEVKPGEEISGGEIPGVESGSKTGKLTIIDGGNYSTSEINAAQYMANLGNDVVLRPPVGTRADGGTSDLLVNGINYDVYTPTTNNPSAIIRAITKKNTQTTGVVLDLSSTTVTVDDLGNILARVRGAIEKNGGTCNINDIVVMPK